MESFNQLPGMFGFLFLRQPDATKARLKRTTVRSDHFLPEIPIRKVYVNLLKKESLPVMSQEATGQDRTGRVRTGQVYPISRVLKKFFYANELGQDLG